LILASLYYRKRKKDALRRLRKPDVKPVETPAEEKEVK